MGSRSLGWGSGFRVYGVWGLAFRQVRVLSRLTIWGYWKATTRATLKMTARLLVGIPIGGSLSAFGLRVEDSYQGFFRCCWGSESQR